jgi:hypothetical protein
MSLSLVYLIFLALALLAGGGLIAGGIMLVLKENKLAGAVLAGLGFLFILCPLAFGAYFIIALNSM